MRHLTRLMLISMLLGVIVGMILHNFTQIYHIQTFIIDGLLELGGKIFITLLKMLVVPIVFVSLVCGTGQIAGGTQFGRMAGKTVVLYLMTTAIAISLALTIAHFLQIGAGQVLETSKALAIKTPPSLKTTLLNIFPENPIKALASGNMLQIIVFALLFGWAMNKSGKPGERVLKFFKDLDKIIITIMHFIIMLSPYGVFCLIAKTFADLGWRFTGSLLGYFVTVLAVLAIQLFVTYPIILKFLGRTPVIAFFKKMLPAMLFAFSTSSSNASIPVVLNTAIEKLDIRENIASFIIPLGATINMDGTAIMQGVATVFIANVYHVTLGFTGYLTVVLTATLASIGTAGIPSVGLIMLTLVLSQVGLPAEGIGLILGVDRLLDMTRTAVNITGDCTVAKVIDAQH